MTEPLQLMMRDVIYELRARARATRERESSKDESYELGRQFGLYEAVSLIEAQANVFGIDPTQIGLAGVDLESEFLGNDKQGTQPPRSE